MGTMKSPVKSLSLFFIFLMTCAAVAGAETPVENSGRIISWKTQISVKSDRSVQVTETARIAAATASTLVRTLPLRYRTTDGFYYVDITLVALTRNRAAEQYRIERTTDTLVVHILTRSFSFGPDESEYVLTYDIKGLVRELPDHDELRWNTDDGFGLPLAIATFTIDLPGSTTSSFLSSQAFTGSSGNRWYGTFLRSKLKTGGLAFTTVYPLPARENMNLYVSWKKGLFTDLRAQKLRDGAAVLSGLVIVLAYYLFVRNRSRSRHLAGTVLFRATPPNGFSPAALRYIRHRKFDNRGVVAAIVNMAVKGALTIHRMGGTFVLTRNPVAESTLSDDEHHLMDGMMGEDVGIELNRANRSRLRRGMRSFRHALRTAYRRDYITHRHRYFVAGILISAACIFGRARWTGMMPVERSLLFSMTLEAFIAACAVAFVVIYGARIVRRWLRERHGFTDALQWLFAAVLLGGYVANRLPVLLAVHEPFSLALAVALAVVNVAFFFSIKVPPPGAAPVMLSIEGFRQHVMALNRETPGPAIESAVEAFQRDLAAAFSLDVGEEWVRYHKNALTFGADNFVVCTPAWYIFQSQEGQDSFMADLEKKIGELA